MRGEMDRGAKGKGESLGAGWRSVWKIGCITALRSEANSTESTSVG